MVPGRIFMTIVCPIDHGVECIQKVTAIVASTAIYSEKLAPPIYPRLPKLPWYFWFPGLFYTILPPIIVWPIMDNLSAKIVILVVFGLFPMGAALLRFNTKKKTFELKVAEYHKDFAYWDRLYYCHRHDRVFDSAANQDQ
jgi:hypothetical protein